jgi:methionyl-tRNA formyltransferase
VSTKKTSIFFGTPAFAVPSLEAALRSTQVLAVVSQPDRPRGRGHAVVPSEVKQAALDLGLATFSPASLRKESEELSRLEAFMSTTRPDFVLVTAYGNLLPQKYLDWARIGPINVHASLLPRWRGAAPIQRALEAGDPETGVCLQRMVMELDAGEVLAETRFKIPTEWGAQRLSEELSKRGGSLLGDFLSDFQGTELRGEPQKADSVTVAAKIRKEEGLFRSSWTARETCGRVRAFEQWPKVQMHLPDGSFVKILACDEAPANLALRPGALYVQGKEVILSCASGAVVLKRAQAPNRGPVEAWTLFQNLGARPPTRQDPLEILNP